MSESQEPSDSVPVAPSYSVPVAPSDSVPVATAIPINEASIRLLALCRENKPCADIACHLAEHPQCLRSGVVDADGATPLHWLALHGNLESIRLLNIPDLLAVPVAKSEMQPIHWACTHGHVNVVSHIVEQVGPASMNVRDGRQTTPLMISTQYRHHALMRWLTAHGADASLEDQDGDTAMHWAAYKDDATALELLDALPGSPLDPTLPDNYGSNCLHLAASMGGAAAAEWLLRRDERTVAGMLGALDAKGRTPVEVARQRGHAHVRRMLEYGPGPLEAVQAWADEASAWWRSALQEWGQQWEQQHAPEPPREMEMRVMQTAAMRPAEEIL